MLRAIALVVFSSLCALGAIRPSFYLAACTWNASDIAVLAPTTRAGTFRVIETIKGELAQGASLTLPGLAASPGGRARLSELSTGDLAHPFEGIPPVGESDWLVVFLRRPGALPEWRPRPDLPVASSGWESANYTDDDLRLSTVWIQDGATYAFQQTMNPGPTHLTTLPMSEAELRKSIQSIVQLRDAMDRAVANPDPVERGRQFAGLVRSGNGIAGMSALEKLEHGSASETNVLFDLLSDQSLLGMHSDFIEALIRKRAADARFGTLLREETAYWLQECPALKPGWWGGMPDPAVTTAKDHYTRAYALLDAVHKLSLAEAMPSVRDFGEAWRTCPAIHKSGKNDQMAEQLKLLTQN